MRKLRGGDPAFVAEFLRDPRNKKVLLDEVGRNLPTRAVAPSAVDRRRASKTVTKAITRCFTLAGIHPGQRIGDLSPGEIYRFMDAYVNRSQKRRIVIDDWTWPSDD